jgi:hypothetical protein
MAKINKIQKNKNIAISFSRRAEGLLLLKKAMEAL